MVMDADQYDRLPCRIADRKRFVHGKYAEIISICALPYDTSLVAVTLEYQSPYQYEEPTLTITRAGDQTGTWTPPFVTGATGQAQTPFISLTKRKQQDFIYDVGAVVPDYIQAAELDWDFYCDGSGTVYTTGVDSIHLTGTWTKGVYFQPLRYKQLSNGRYVLYYQAELNSACPCKIFCEAPSGRTFTGIIDPGPPDICRTRDVPLYVDNTSGNALHGELGFQFTNGQKSNFSFDFLADMIPKNPEVSSWGEGVRIRIPWRDMYNNTFDNAWVRVERYIGTQGNVSIVLDWEKQPLDYVYDSPLWIGIPYGYRIMYLGEFGEISYASDWITYTRTE